MTAKEIMELESIYDELMSYLECGESGCSGNVNNKMVNSVLDKFEQFNIKIKTKYFPNETF